MDMKKTVVVGMSGGVDSSVTALLLKEQGYHVIGMFMKNWEEKDPDGVCISSKEYEDVVRVCDQLDIPHYSVNFVEEYWNQVFVHFLEDLKKGYTPNPDILCNREIKFKVFLDKAMQLGADYLATGHYARIVREKGKASLLKGCDPHKDQSYFLYTLTSSVLDKVLFPIGDLEKSKVRAIAHEHQLATAAKKDSTGICFIGKRNFKEFLKGYLSYQPGNFINLKGEVVGTHEGVAYYTLGQRKGLGIGGPGEPWFVVAKDIQNNTVTIERGTDHPALYADSLTATDLTWVNAPPQAPYACTARIRYRQEDQECIIEKIENNHVTVRFLQPQRAITPGQSIVFYHNDTCLGGGLIKAT